MRTGCAVDKKRQAGSTLLQSSVITRYEAKTITYNATNN